MATLVVALLMVCPDAHGARWWGELGYNFRLEKSDAGSEIREHIPILRLNASSYLYRPWLATIDGGLQLQLNRAQLDTGERTSDNVTGDVVIRLLPLSQFPLELFAERTDTRTSTDLTGLELERTRYGFLQRYSTQTGTSLRLRYEHLDLTNLSETPTGGEEERTDVGDFFEAGFQKSNRSHRVNFDTNFNRIDTLDSPLRTTTSFTSLRHAYRPGARLSADDMLTYSTSDLEQEFSQINTNILQLTSFAFWRPDLDKPLRLNATLRAVGRETSTAAGSDVSTIGATGNLFANYEYNDNWIFGAGLGGTGAGVGKQNEFTSFQTARATYNSDTGQILGLDASWFGQVQVGNDLAEEISVQNFDTQIGYNLGRNWALFNGILRGELRQSIGQRLNTEDISATRLLTDASVMWSLQQTNRSTIARLAISDSRTEVQGGDITGLEGEFQVANAQLSVNHRFSPGSSLNGNISLQAIRDFRPSQVVFGDPDNGDWRPTATADVTFLAQSLFNIDRLSFRSTLRFISDAYIPLMDPVADRGRNNKYWENRFDYLIGRTQIRVIGRWTNLSGDDRILALFQIRRFIGDV